MARPDPAGHPVLTVRISRIPPRVLFGVRRPQQIPVSNTFTGVCRHPCERRFPAESR
jgi:hypothetical protein